jgi:hypothetical protein
MCRSAYFSPIIILVVLLVIVFGCSGGNPVSLDYSMREPKTDYQNNRQVWGIWEIEINPDTGDAAINPCRGAMFNANIVKFLQPPLSPTQMLSVQIEIADSDFANDYVVVNLTINHPFPGANKYRGFDVRGIFMSTGSKSVPYIQIGRLPDWFNASPGQSSPDSVLLNADGYTRWWNRREFTSEGTIFGYTYGTLAPDFQDFTAVVNPFKYFTDELGPDDPFELDPANRGTFSVEKGSNTRRYEIQFENKPWKFLYAIDSSWALPDPVYSPDYPIEAFSLSANTQEPYKITLTDAGSSVWYEDVFNHGGSFLVDIEVFDWQALDGSGVTQQIDNIWLHSPAFEMNTGWADTWKIYDLEASKLPGGSQTSSVYRAEIPAEFGNIHETGEFPVLIGVWNSAPESYEPQIESGSENFDYPDGRLCAYDVATVTVLPKPELPVILSVIPSEGLVNTQITDVEIHGENFTSTTEITFIHSVSSIEFPVPANYIDDTLLTTDLDLTGWPTGKYDVEADEPGVGNTTLLLGFEALKEAGYNLVLEPEIILPGEFDATNLSFPAICVENDGDVVTTFIEWWQNDAEPFNYRSYSSAWKSIDDGSSFTDFASQMNTNYIDPPWIFGYSTKIFPSSTGTSWRTFNHMNFDTWFIKGFPPEWWIGYADTTFDGPYNHETATYAHDIDHANEIVQGGDLHVYLFGDRDDQITFKRSELPERLEGGPNTNMWDKHEVYPFASPGRLSRARASALYDGTAYVAYYNPTENKIMLAAQSSDDWQAWDHHLVYQAASPQLSDVADPGLFVDETGFYITFTYFQNVGPSGSDNIIFMHSTDGVNWTDPVNLHSIFGKYIDENPIYVYDYNGSKVIAICWWEGDLIYASFAVDDFNTWSDPVVISTLYELNSYPDFWINDESDNWHFTYSGMNPGTGLWEVHYRRGHLE